MAGRDNFSSFKEYRQWAKDVYGVTGTGWADIDTKVAKAEAGGREPKGPTKSAPKAAAAPKAPTLRKAPKTRPMKRLATAEAKAAADRDRTPDTTKTGWEQHVRRPRITHTGEIVESAGPAPKRRSGGPKTEPVYQARRDFVRRKGPDGKFVTRLREAPATKRLHYGTKPLEQTAKIREREAREAGRHANRVEAQNQAVAAKSGKRRAPKTKPLSNRFIYGSGERARGNPRYRPETPTTQPVYRASDLQKGKGGHLYVRQAPATRPNANQQTAPHGETAGRKAARAEPSVRSRAAVKSVPPRPRRMSESMRHQFARTAAKEGHSDAYRIPGIYVRHGSRNFPRAVRHMSLERKQDIIEAWKREGHVKTQGDPTRLTDDQANQVILRHVAHCPACRGERKQG